MNDANTALAYFPKISSPSMVHHLAESKDKAMLVEVPGYCATSNSPLWSLKVIISPDAFQLAGPGSRFPAQMAEVNEYLVYYEHIVETNPGLWKLRATSENAICWSSFTVLTIVIHR